MQRRLNLRQIEAFKAVIESGTVSRGADLIHVSQPAMSKLLAHLESATELPLFDRVRGRLVPTEHGLRLYDEIDRIFAGVRQVENAVEAIRREEQGQLAIGVMPALAGSFIPRAVAGLLKEGPPLRCTVRQESSERILDWVVTRKLDVGLVGLGFDHPDLLLEPFLEHPLVCIMPSSHPLTAKRRIEPSDLDRLPFLTLHSDTYIGRQIEHMCATYAVQPRTLVITNVAPTLFECVVVGMGVALVHPLSVSGLEHRLAVRRFKPLIPYHFQICRSADGRNARIVDAFASELRKTALEMSRSLLPVSQRRRRRSASG